MNGNVSVRLLKAFAASQFRDYPLMRQLILQEPDLISREEFLIKFKIWMWLLTQEKERTGSREFAVPDNRPVVR